MKQQEYDDIHIETEIRARPEHFYAMWLDSEGHSKMLGKPVVISNRVGASFQVGDGVHPGAAQSGVIVELVPNRRIVQMWRRNGVPEWKDGEYSVLTLTLERKGENTKLILDQKGIPHSFGGQRIEKGWKEVYLASIQKWFASEGL